MMVTILSEKKESGEQVLNLVKKLTKLLICLVMTLHPMVAAIH